MNNLYNFEAIFGLFLKSRKISRNQEKGYLVFFRSFINWLVYSLDFTTRELTVSAFLPCLSQESLSKYQNFLRESKFSKGAIYQRYQLLKDFRSFLENHPTLPIRPVTNPTRLMESALIDDFIGELIDKGAPRSTIRSYKSDISQFFGFLKHESAQNI